MDLTSPSTGPFKKRRQPRAFSVDPPADPTDTVDPAAALAIPGPSGTQAVHQKGKKKAAGKDLLTMPNKKVRKKMSSATE